jgi:hypothetical protein
LHELRKREAKEQKARAAPTRAGQNDKSQQASSDSGTDDFDGLSGFFSSFQLALVLFVMAPSSNEAIRFSIAHQLDDIDSYFHRAQRVSFRHQQEAEAVTPSTDDDYNTPSRQSQSSRKSCVILLPDTLSAIQNLIAVADAITPERKESKLVLFRRLEAKHFHPCNSDAGERNQEASSSSSAAASVHVAGGLREIAKTFELPPGEANILMSELKDLRTIATADDSLLEMIPIDQRTRRVLHGFFGSSGGPTRASTGTRLQHQQPFDSLQHHTDSHSLTGVATELFPRSNSSPSSTSPFLTHRSPRGRPVAPPPHPFHAHQHVSRVEPPPHHSFDSSLMDEDEFWMDTSDALAQNADPFFDGDNDIDTDFDVHSHVATNGGSSDFYRSSRFPAFSHGVRNENDSYLTLAGSQPYYEGHQNEPPDDFQLRNFSLEQNHPYQYPVEQPFVSDHYARSQSFPDYQNQMDRPIDSRPPGLPFASIRQREHRQREHPQRHPANQRPRFPHSKRFQR